MLGLPGKIRSSNLVSSLLAINGVSHSTPVPDLRKNPEKMGYPLFFLQKGVQYIKQTNMRVLYSAYQFKAHLVTIVMYPFQTIKPLLFLSQKKSFQSPSTIILSFFLSISLIFSNQISRVPLLHYLIKCDFGFHWKYISYFVSLYMLGYNDLIIFDRILKDFFL